MKLTNYIRDAFVTSIMQDVPTIDYSEQIHKVFRDDAHDQLPKDIKAAIKAGHEEYVQLNYFYPEGARCSGRIGVRQKYEFKSSPEAKEKIEQLHELLKAQNESHDALRSKLRGAIYSVNSVKAALDIMPDFAKYLPSEATPTKGLPAIANLVSDLSALGWEKPEPAQQTVSV